MSSALIESHCAAMAQLDRAYAVWALRQYRAAMPWLWLGERAQEMRG